LYGRIKINSSSSSSSSSFSSSSYYFSVELQNNMEELQNSHLAFGFTTITNDVLEPGMSNLNHKLI
jgi:hypothetical protein